MRTDRQTDIHDKDNSRLSQFCERALKCHTALDSKGIYYAPYSFKQVNLFCESDELGSLWFMMGATYQIKLQEVKNY